MVRVAINGYGRIGRLAHRIVLEKHARAIEVVAINAGSSTDLRGWLYLLKYDTSYGQVLNHSLSTVSVSGDSSSASWRTQNDKKDMIGKFVIDGKEIPMFSQKDPALLPWKDLGIDVVLECTGHFREGELLRAHIQAGAKAVVLSAPVKDKDGGEEVPTYVLSVNTQNYKGEQVISNASCTTNCIAPVAKVMSDHFGIEKAMMTTVHGYTSDQRLQDGGHKDYRRARAAAENIIPTSTGATSAAAKALPALKDIFTGLAIRVPVGVGSLSDFTFLLKRNTTVDEVNNAFISEANSEVYRGILAVTNDPIVSSDIIGNPHSAIVDLSLTQVISGNMVKVIAWYDNEYGYASRLVEEVLMIANSK